MGLSSADVELDRLVRLAIELRGSTAETVTRGEVKGAGGTQACQGTEKRINVLYPVLLETTTNVKPVTIPDL